MEDAAGGEGGGAAAANEDKTKEQSQQAIPKVNRSYEWMIQGECLYSVYSYFQTHRRKSSYGSDDGDGEKKPQNQFSFVERATQTMNNAMKVPARPLQS